MTINDERRRLTEPLESVTTFFGALMLIGALLGAALLIFGSGSFGGFSSSVCVTQPGAHYSSSNWNTPFVHAKPGNSVSIDGSLQVCANHATAGEQALNILADLPAALFWGGILFLLWRMIVTARRNGPFTPRVAASMRRLGWFVIIGSTTAAILHLIAIDALLQIMSSLGSPFPNLILVPLQAPVPVLTGAALLTFARIVKVGAALDAEVQATI